MTQQTNMVHSLGKLFDVTRNFTEKYSLSSYLSHQLDTTQSSISDDYFNVSKILQKVTLSYTVPVF